MVLAKTFLIIAILLSCLPALRAGAADVSIKLEDKVYHVQTPQYEATVEADGCLTSLKVSGAEFVKSAPGFPRGVYMYQDGLLPLPTVEQSAPDVIAAGGSDKASVRYQFGPDSMTWTLTNLTAKQELLIIVFDLAVSAVMDERGRCIKTPTERDWPVSTWFRTADPKAPATVPGRIAKLRITGSNRLWGPWAGNHQVWQLNLGPNETKEVKLQVGQATDAEAAKAAETAAQVIAPPTDPVGPMWGNWATQAESSSRKPQP